MRELAYSSTQGEYKAAEERLRSCCWFKPPVQKYVENKWLSVKEVRRLMLKNKTWGLNTDSLHFSFEELMDLLMTCTGCVQW